jgi:hypothetical protein
MGRIIEKVALPLFRESCGPAQRTRFARTFPGREVFFPTRMSSGKTDFNFFAPAGANSARLRGFDYALT